MGGKRQVCLLCKRTNHREEAVFYKKRSSLIGWLHVKRPNKEKRKYVSLHVCMEGVCSERWKPIWVRKGLKVVPLCTTVHARSFMHRKGSGQERICGCTHQRLVEQLLFMFHISFIFRSAAPSPSMILAFFLTLNHILYHGTFSHEPGLEGLSQEYCLCFSVIQALGKN